MGSIRDINVNIENVNFVCRSCAIIINNNKILFQKRKADKFWALPGGKIEILETTAEAVKREIKEELGIENIEVGDVLSVTENFFEWNGNKVHQYLFTHKVSLNDNIYDNIESEFNGKEEGKDVVFKWIKKEDITNEKIKPDYVIDQLLNIDSGMKFSTCIENV